MQDPRLTRSLLAVDNPRDPVWDAVADSMLDNQPPPLRFDDDVAPVVLGQGEYQRAVDIAAIHWRGCLTLVLLTCSTVLVGYALWRIFR